MFTALILLAAMDAAPTPAAARTTTPVVAAGTGHQTRNVAARPVLTPTPAMKAETHLPAPPPRDQALGTRTLSDVARERKLGVKGSGSFSAAQSTVAPAAGKMTDQEKWELEHGEPLHRNVTFTSDGGTSEQLVYPNGVYVYFRNGKFAGGQVPVMTTNEKEKLLGGSR